MTTIGIIGSGNIGAAIARLAVAAGVDVVVANSRGPASLTGLVDELAQAPSSPVSADVLRHSIATTQRVDVAARS